MKTLIRLNIEKFQENGQEYFVATSEQIQGLVAEGSTIEEVIEIASDLAKILLELDQDNSQTIAEISQCFEYPCSNLRTTISHHREIKEGTLRNILKQAKITVDDFLDS